MYRPKISDRADARRRTKRLRAFFRVKSDVMQTRIYEQGLKFFEHGLEGVEQWRRSVDSVEGGK